MLSAPLVMLDTRHDLHLRCGVPRQLVGDQHPWGVTQALEELAEKAFRRLPVTPTLHEDIEHMAILVDWTPKVLAPALDGYVASFTLDKIGFSRLGSGFDPISTNMAMPDNSEDAGVFVPTAPAPRALTINEFHRLAELQPAIAWFANLDSFHTSRAYKNDVGEFMCFKNGLFGSRGKQITS